MMEHKRKIERVVTKVSFAEAEEADDKYWTNATIDERLNELLSLRQMVFGNDNDNLKMQKVVHKRSIYEEQD